MANSIETLLHKSGPRLTSELIVALKDTGLNEAAARKRIQRAGGKVRQLPGIRFEKNARFFYLENQHGDEKFWREFENACYRSGKSYWASIASLKSRGGVVPIDLFPRVAGTPITRKGQLSPEGILKRLQYIGLLETFFVSEREYVRLKHFSCDQLPTVRANELAEAIALMGVADWARKIGFGSYNKFAKRFDTDPPPIVSGISWDLSAPSYIRPLVSVRNGGVVPGFIVCDINLRDVIRQEEAESFLRKCDMAAAPKNVPPILPILIGHLFEEKALSLLKSKGVLAVALRNLFGDELAGALRDLVFMLSDLGNRIAADPNRLIEVMDSLGKIQGASGHLFGHTFELLIGGIVNDVEDGFLKIGEIHKDFKTGREAEVDVKFDHREENRILLIECKAKAPGSRVSEIEIKKWYGDRVPLIYSILSSGGTYTEKKYRFELWSNGQFTKSGVSWLRAQNTACEGYTIGWKQADELKNYADRAESRALKKMLNEHYFAGQKT